MDKQTAIAKAVDTVNAHRLTWSTTTPRPPADVTQAIKDAIAAGATGGEIVAAWAATQH